MVVHTNINYNNNNVAYFSCKFTQLPVIYNLEFQREIDKNRVDDIIKSYEIELLNEKYCTVFGCILLAELDNKLYLLDGQHRLNSVMQIHKKYQYDSDLNILVYKCNNFQHIFEHFKKINQNQLVPEWNLSTIDHSKIFKKSIETLRKKYENYITTKSSMIPKINLNDYFQILLNFRVLFNYNIQTSEDLVKYIENVNRTLYISLQKYKSIAKIAKRLDFFEKKAENDVEQLYLSAITIKNWNSVYLNSITINEDLLINI